MFLYIVNNNTVLNVKFKTLDHMKNKTYLAILSKATYWPPNSQFMSNMAASSLTRAITCNKYTYLHFKCCQFGLPRSFKKKLFLSVSLCVCVFFCLFLLSSNSHGLILLRHNLFVLNIIIISSYRSQQVFMRPLIEIKK